jgi:hypothetical protein
MRRTPKVGEQWAYRDRPRTTGEPFRPVEVLQLGPPRSRKIRVRWLDGEYPGLDEWVSALRLVAPWEAADIVLRDEANQLSLERAQPKPLDDIQVLAVQQVWFGIEEGPITFNAEKGRPIEAVVDDPARVEGFPIEKDRLLSSDGAYVDTGGALHVGQDMAVELAVVYARRFADRVLQRATEDLERVRHSVVTGWYHPGAAGWDPWPIDSTKAREWLEESEAVFEILRGWCGGDQAEAFDERQALRLEVARLRGLIADTCTWLRGAGHPQKAARLERAAKSGGSH